MPNKQSTSTNTVFHGSEIKSFPVQTINKHPFHYHTNPITLKRNLTLRQNIEFKILNPISNFFFNVSPFKEKLQFAHRRVVRGEKEKKIQYTAYESKIEYGIRYLPDLARHPPQSARNRDVGKHGGEQ